MTEKFQAAVFPIQCRGRDAEGREVLPNPVSVQVEVQGLEDRKTIDLTVQGCPHTAGSHGQRCRASYPAGVEKAGDGIACAYAFGIPHTAAYPSSNGYAFPSQAASFSESELKVVPHLAEGASNKTIANSLGLAEATVKIYVKGILNKLRVHNRTQAAIKILAFQKLPQRLVVIPTDQRPYIRDDHTGGVHMRPQLEADIVESR